jgi:hypothetical protein
MKFKDMMWNIQSLGENSILSQEMLQSAKFAEYLLSNLANMFEMTQGMETEALLSIIRERTQPVAVDPSLGERYQALLHFVEQVAPVLDQAAECEVAGADQMKALYRTLNLSTPAEVHPDAGLTAFLISGRESGDDDDAAEVVIAADLDEAKRIFFMSQFDVEYNEADAEKDDPPYFTITDDEIGVVDSKGRIVLK